MISGLSRSAAAYAHDGVVAFETQPAQLLVQPHRGQVGITFQQLRDLIRRSRSKSSVLMTASRYLFAVAIWDAANLVKPSFFIPHNSRKIAKSRKIPAQFPQI